MNKKVINATSIEYEGIKFRSRLEVSCYKILKESNLNPSYEPDRITLWVGFKPEKVQYLAPNKRKEFKLVVNKHRDITYTPDFKVLYKNYVIYYDVKGNPNDVYPIKKKLFLKYLEHQNDDKFYIFIEPHNIKQIKQSINYIKLL